MKMKRENGERISDAERDLGAIAGGRSEKRGSEERESNHWRRRRRREQNSNPRKLKSGLLRFMHKRGSATWMEKWEPIVVCSR